MKHLSGMDASVLHLETTEIPKHVGGMHTLELAAGYRGDFYEDFKRHSANRLHSSQVFKRKLALMPFELSPGTHSRRRFRPTFRRSARLG